MENKLEQLLNSLIERGWKPFGKIPVNINQWNNTQTYCKCFDKSCIHIHREDDIEDEEIRRPRRTDEFSLRELVSKESGLRQFCTENGLVNQDKDDVQKWTHQSRRHIYDKDCWIENNNLYNDDYEYRVIESALKDESELEDFLLSNIVIKDE